MDLVTLSKDKNDISFNYKLLFWYAVLFLYAFNFMGVGDIFPLLTFPYVLYVIATSRFSKSFMASMITLASFSVVYALFIFIYNYSSIIGIVGRLIYPVVFLVAGYTLINERTSYKQILNYLYVVVLGLSTYGVFSLFKSLNLYGNVNNMMNIFGGRKVIDLWSDGFISATALTAYVSFSLSLLPTIFFKEISRFKKFLIVVLFIASFYTIIQTSSRTGLLIIGSSLLTVAVFTDRFSMKKIYRLFMTALLAIVGTFLYNLNLFNLKASFEGTMLFQRMATTNLQDDSRIDAWGTVLSSLFKYPLGGKGTDLRVGYAHNLWLDVGYEGGLIPFILLLSFTIVSLYAVYRFLKTDHPVYFKGITISLLTALGMIFFLEPVLQGITVLFMFYCFLVGVIFKVNYLSKMGIELQEGKIERVKKKNRRKKYKFVWK